MITVVIQQKKCKGYINLLPIVNGRVVKSKIETVLPHRFHLMHLIEKTMLRVYK